MYYGIRRSDQIKKTLTKYLNNINCCNKYNRDNSERNVFLVYI